MTLLLDSHALIWFAEDDPNLSRRAKAAVEDAANSVFYSAATIWELAIKLQLGKIRMSLDLASEFRQRLEERGFEFLPIDYGHAAHVASLPLHHRDPFDRLLVAQAKLEGLTMISHDGQLDAYGIHRLW